MKDCPKISVIMPVHNGEKYLKTAIDSILGQTFSDFEFIIVNDGSSDNTEKIIDSFHDERIKIIKNTEKIGVSKSLNRAIESSRGDFIARMDADDISLPERLEKQIRYLEENHDIGIVGSNAYLINSDDKVTGRYKRPESHVLVKWTALFSNPMIHPSIMARANILRENKYNEEFKNGQDYELWSRLIFSKNIKFDNISESLIKYRIHDSSVTRDAINKNKTPVSLQIGLNNINFLKLEPVVKEKFYRLISSPEVSIIKIFRLTGITKMLEKIFIKKENLKPKEIRSIKKDNRRRYNSLIKRYFKQKIYFLIDIFNVR
jgi:glycosyltransferase involved in cell wall biosynthesis